MRTADTMDEPAERSQAISTRSNFWTVRACILAKDRLGNRASRLP